MATNVQYPTGRSGPYVSKAAEEPLDGGNPFKQVSTDEPVSNADAAAVSAVLSRDKPPSIIGTLQPGEKLDSGKIVSRDGDDVPASKDDKNSNGHIDGVTEDGNSGNGARTAPLFRPKGESDTQTNAGGEETQEEGGTEDDDGDDGFNTDDISKAVSESNPRSSLKRSRSPSSAEVGTKDVDSSDSDTRHIAKRARRDSRSLVVEPGDSAREEERKIRANLARHAVVEEGEGEEEEGRGEVPDRHDDDNDDDNEQVGYTKVVEPETTREGLLRTQNPDRASTGVVEGMDEVDETGDDDDVEAKRGDDYDAENYAEFEDDDDDTENLDPGERLV
ncbi:hypothetical protein VTH82DRAFT_4569 [Thermothelomyces myriococcoides]